MIESLYYLIELQDYRPSKIDETFQKQEKENQWATPITDKVSLWRIYTVIMGNV